MSTSLYWSEIPKEPKDGSLYSLKWIIAERLWDSDGSSGESPIIVGEELLPFLEGIVACGDKDKMRDANILISAIKTHKQVQLYIHS